MIVCSGTTGDPKPVEYTHLFYGNAWTYIFLPEVYGREHFYDLMYPGNGTRFLLTSAPFHAMSATCALPMSVFGQGTLCPGFRHRAITTGDIREYLEFARVTKAALTPWMMEEIARRPNPERYIKPFESVLFGGGELHVFQDNCCVLADFVCFQPCFHLMPVVFGQNTLTSR